MVPDYGKAADRPLRDSGRHDNTADVDVTKFLKRVEGADFYRDQIVHTHTIPTRKARFAPMEMSLPVPLRDVLRQTGIEKLYSHQVDAVGALRKGLIE